MADRVALITGCGNLKGIGAASARALSSAGVWVAVTSAPLHSTTAENLDALVKEIVAAGGTAFSSQGDVSVEADASRMVSGVVDRYGRLDILVNNAGAPQGKDRAPIEDVPLEAWELQMAVNARGVFLMSRAAVTPMRKHGWGRIINISSSSAKIAGKYQAVYAASKAAVSGFTRSLALELAPYGITVNEICPYSILTRRSLGSAARTAGSNDPVAIERALAKKAEAIPVGRHGRPEEVAGMVVYLASEFSGYVTGQSLSICGGVT